MQLNILWLTGEKQHNKLWITGGKQHADSAVGAESPIKAEKPAVDGPFPV
jgi:hypothetical protein